VIEGVHSLLKPDIGDALDNLPKNYLGINIFARLGPKRPQHTKIATCQRGHVKKMIALVDDSVNINNQNTFGESLRAQRGP